MYYLSLNRNKRSLTLNLASDKDREIYYGLVKKADIVIDNFRPGVLANLGADYGRLREIKPGIICCSISAFGLEGPYYLAGLPLQRLGQGYSGVSPSSNPYQ